MRDEDLPDSDQREKEKREIEIETARKLHRKLLKRPF